MKPAYMPLTCLPESTARLLAALVGPVVVYQPSKTNVPERLSAMQSQGLVEIRTPLTGDDERLSAALAEFTNWARMNPGSSTPGSAFFSSRQGQTPFFDETTINQIRTDINQYRSPAPRSNRSEAQFSARLFLAVAQEYDLATASLDQNLSQFKAMEKDFLETLKDADDAGFNRQPYSGTIWQEDPAGKLTEQRIRAWAALAAADNRLPELMITTSSAMIDTLSEIHGAAIRFEKLTVIRLPIPPDGTAPVLGQALADLISLEKLPPTDFCSLKALAADPISGPVVTVTLFAAVNRTAATVIRKMAPAATVPPEENEKPSSVCHTLFVLVES